MSCVVNNFSGYVITAFIMLVCMPNEPLVVLEYTDSLG